MHIQISPQLKALLISLPAFFISIAFHEFAHAYTAYKKGDALARSQGRMTLNPLKHIDLIGTVIMPLMAITSGLSLIGWAKPVPINPNAFSNPLKDQAIVSAAGPAANFLLAILFALLLGLSKILHVLEFDLAILFLMYGIYINIFLAIFNLLPFPPLDGSHILYGIFPNKFTQALMRMGFMGGIILLLLLNTVAGKFFFKFIDFIFQKILVLVSIL